MKARVSIIIRARNDMPLIRRTIAALKTQTLPLRVFAFDNASTDGTREELAGFADQLIDVPDGSYVPGKVLNHGMRISDSEFVVFLNSDCVPMHPECLENLLAAFSVAPEERCAAVFGRQIPRQDCIDIFYKDTEDTFGDGLRQKYWKHCFSMASSAVSRKVWEKYPFREDIQYSEDIDWTWRVRQEGFSIRYAADSTVEHSHNYTPAQFYRRQFGEGRAEAAIFSWTDWERTWLRYSLLPFIRQILSDYRFAASEFHPKLFFQSPVYRLMQMIGRRKGFNEGCREVFKK